MAFRSANSLVGIICPGASERATSELSGGSHKRDCKNKKV